MSNGRKPVPYPTSLWAKPPGDFITRRPCQRVGFAHEISIKKRNGYGGLLKFVSFILLKYRNRLPRVQVAGMRLSQGVRSRGTETSARDAVERTSCHRAFVHGGLKLISSQKSQRTCCHRAFVHRGLKRDGHRPRCVIGCHRAFVHGGLKHIKEKLEAVTGRSFTGVISSASPAWWSERMKTSRAS